MAKEIGQQAVPYSQVLDGFGNDIKEIIKKLQADSLKPALTMDIIKILSMMFGIQQLLVMMYNLNVQNFELQMAKLIGLETKVAGYSERLNGIDKKIADLEKRLLNLKG